MHNCAANKKSDTTAKEIAWKGYKGKYLTKYLHPSRLYLCTFPNVPSNNRLENCTVVQRDTKTVNCKQDRSVIIILLELFQSFDGEYEEVCALSRWFISIQLSTWSIGGEESITVTCLTFMARLILMMIMSQLQRLFHYLLMIQRLVMSLPQGARLCHDADVITWDSRIRVGDEKKRIRIPKGGPVWSKSSSKYPDIVCNHFQNRHSIDAHNGSSMFPISLEET